MNELTKYLIDPFLNEEQSSNTTAIYGGGFKPPTKGHFEVVKLALEKHPDVDEFIIYVGKKERDGVTQEESMKIWDIYKKYLSPKVKVVKGTKPPIKAIYNLAKENPTYNIKWVIGSREGNDEDASDLISRTKSISKYPNIELSNIITEGGISGTKTRKSLKEGSKEFYKNLPQELTQAEKDEIYALLNNELMEKQDLNEAMFAEGAATNLETKEIKIMNIEHASHTNSIDLNQEILKFTKYLINEGYNIKPLPKVKFVHGDVENANNFLGPTAYYDPRNKLIVLYTQGRHPKDIVRSYSHELVHHTQNLEGRLNNIDTTNINEDDYLTKLESEANLVGTMSFRSYTDKVKKEALLEKNKKELGLDAFTYEISRLDEDGTSYKIFCDMDGVIADFEAQFKSITGETPDQFRTTKSQSEFWEEVSKGGVGFWRKIPLMVGAKELISYISKHDYELLTAPSTEKESLIGKTLWVKDHTGSLFPSKPKINFKAAKNKPQFAAPNHILIDDRKDTIDAWIAKGGIGIHHTSAEKSISELKELGL